MVKRGCAKRDLRYKNRTGCEEQITGSGNFRLVLCLCDRDLCNGKTFYRSNAVAVSAARAEVAAISVLFGALFT